MSCFLDENDPLEVFHALLDSMPPVSQLIAFMPHSLPLIERIFRLYHLLRRSGNARESSWRQLECVQMLNKMLWWFAFLHEHRSTSKRRACETTLIHKLEPPFTAASLAECLRNAEIIFNFANSNLPSFDSSTSSAMLKSESSESQRRKRSVSSLSLLSQTKPSNWSLIRSILEVIREERPEILDDILAERKQLAECLECLGCHGFVNVHPTGRLVRLLDATVFECAAQKERLKKVVRRLRFMQKNFQEYDVKSPSQASHQHQIDLKLSQVCERLRQNEVIEKMIAEVLYNDQLMNLLRIVRKRIQADKILIGMFNSYTTTIPKGFFILDKNPVVAKLIFTFKMAYDQFSSLLNMPTLNEKENIETFKDSTNFEKKDMSRQINTNEYFYDENSLNDFKLPEGTLAEGDSFTIFSGNTLDYRFASGTMPNIIESILETDMPRKSSKPSRTSRFNNATKESERKDEAEVEAHYFEADACIRTHKSSATKFAVDRVDESLVMKFLNLFDVGRIDVLNALNLLPEMRNCRALQQKAMLFAVTMCFEKARKSYEECFTRALELISPSFTSQYHSLPIKKCENSDMKMLRYYVYRIAELGVRSREENREFVNEIIDNANAKLGIVSLQSCTRFSCFVSDCMSVCGELAKNSTIRLEFESDHFDEEKYVRSTDSSISCSSIRQCLWPGITATVDADGGEEIILKAIALT